MAKIERDELPPPAQRLLEVIEAAPAGCERSDIIAAMGRSSRLSGHELAHLQYLETLGFITATRRRGELAYTYRIADKG